MLKQLISTIKQMASTLKQMTSTLKQMTSKVNTYDADVKTTDADVKTIDADVKTIDADVKTIDIDVQTNGIEGQYKGNRRSIQRLLTTLQLQSKVNTYAAQRVTCVIEGQYIRRSTTYIRLFLPPVSGEAFDIRPLTFVLRP